jgi:hypothetical protein
MKHRNGRIRAVKAPARGTSRTAPETLVAQASPSSPAVRGPWDGRLLDRILDLPHLAHSVPRLQPELLHKVIQSCGLEDCGELVALTTPEQLGRVLDLDLWRSAGAGRDEQFDPDRFGLWLEVLAESGVNMAAQKLAGMDPDLVITGLAQHVRVFDSASVTPYTTTDGQEVTPIPDLGDGLTSDVGSYRLVSRRIDASGSWDAIVAVMTALAADHHDYFHQVMGGCRTLSNSTPEIDGLDDLLTDADQVMFDVAFDREHRREKRGYVTPAQARAFLRMSRQLRLGSDARPLANPVARAYFRAIDQTTATDDPGMPRLLPAGSDAASLPEDPSAAVAEVVDLLREAGIVAQQPRALLNASQEPSPRLALIQAQMQLVLERDPSAYSARSEELAYLANTVLAGCSIQARPFTPEEASDAAVAVCNLGLQNWPARWIDPKLRRGGSIVEAGLALPDDFLAGQDLVSVFQVGWTILHDDVSMDVAERLIGVLADLQCEDVQTELDALRGKMTKHWRAGAPWRARDALDVIAILDMPAWAALLALIDECPVLHAGLTAAQVPGTRAVSATAFEFISENSQIASIREFMRSLPGIFHR